MKDDPKKTDKEKKLLEQKELAMLFKPVQTQKIEKGQIWQENKRFYHHDKNRYLQAPIPSP